MWLFQIPSWTPRKITTICVAITETNLVRTKINSGRINPNFRTYPLLLLGRVKVSEGPETEAADDLNKGAHILLRVAYFANLRAQVLR